MYLLVSYWLSFWRQGLTSLVWPGTFYVDQASFSPPSLKCCLQACAMLKSMHIISTRQPEAASLQVTLSILCRVLWHLVLRTSLEAGLWPSVEQALAPRGRTDLHMDVSANLQIPWIGLLELFLPSFDVSVTQGPTFLKLEMWILRRPQQSGKILYLQPHFRAAKVQVGMVMEEARDSFCPDCISGDEGEDSVLEVSETHKCRKNSHGQIK